MLIFYLLQDDNYNVSRIISPECLLFVPHLSCLSNRPIRITGCFTPSHPWQDVGRCHFLRPGFLFGRCWTTKKGGLVIDPHNQETYGNMGIWQGYTAGLLTRQIILMDTYTLIRTIELWSTRPSLIGSAWRKFWRDTSDFESGKYPLS